MYTQQQVNFGAALYTICQHPTSPRVFALDCRSYLINDKRTVFFKRATTPRKSGGYQFTFSLKDVEKILDLYKKYGSVYMGLICVAEGVVCCLPYSDFIYLWEMRQKVAGDLENQFVLNVVSKSNHQLQVTAPYPDRRGTSLTSPIIIPRSDFPNCLCA